MACQESLNIKRRTTTKALQRSRNDEGTYVRTDPPALAAHVLVGDSDDVDMLTEEVPRNAPGNVGEH